LTIRLITKTILHCTCVWCKFEWNAFEKPKRCSNCKRYSWNGEDQRRRDPLEYVPPGSVLDEEVPELRHKDILDALMLARAMIEQVIADFGPCKHPSDRVAKEKEDCVCHEQQVLDKINRQIDLLNRFIAAGSQTVKYVRTGRGKRLA